MSKARDIADLDFNSPDIDGGNIDGAVIGATTRANGDFLAISASSTLTVEGDAQVENLYKNQSLTASSASLVVSNGVNTQQASSAFWDTQHPSYAGQIHLVGCSSFSGTLASAGELQYWTFDGSSYVKEASFGPTGYVFNEASRDADFRVESGGNANMLFVDGGKDTIGIGVAPLDNNLSPALQFASGGTMFGYGDAMYITGNTYYNGGWKAIATGGGANTVIDSSGFKVYNNASASADATISPLLHLTVGPSEMVINEDSYDYDFRVESNNLTHALAVDAGLNTVFIGENAPYEYAGLQIKSNNKWFSMRSNVGNGGVFAQPPVPSGGSGVAVGWNGSNGTGEGNFVSAHPSTLTGGLRFHDYNSTTATYTELFRAHYSGAGQFSVNDGQADIDFKVSSTGNTHMLFVDAGNSRVGIGDSSPDVALSVVTSGSNEQFHVQSPTPGMKFIDSNLTTRCFTIGGENGSVSIHADPNNAAGSSNILLRADGSTIAQFDSAGLKFFGDTATANALDDYEEGYWHPYISDGSTSVSLGSTAGYYTKIGRAVVLGMNAYNKNISSLSATAHLRITGLPFIPNLPLYCNAMMAQRNPVVSGISENGNTTMLLYKGDNNAVDYGVFTRNVWGGTSTMTFRFECTYQTNA